MLETNNLFGVIDIQTVYIPHWLCFPMPNVHTLVQLVIVGTPGFKSNKTDFDVARIHRYAKIQPPPRESRTSAWVDPLNEPVAEGL